MHIFVINVIFLALLSMVSTHAHAVECNKNTKKFNPNCAQAPDLAPIQTPASKPGTDTKAPFYNNPATGAEVFFYKKPVTNIKNINVPDCQSSSNLDDFYSNVVKQPLSNKLFENFLQSRSKLKSDEELDQYLNCYATGRFCHFQTQLKDYIKLASHVSGLPYAIQVCLFAKESGLDPYAKSPVGASGYCQFMPCATTQVNKIIRGNWQKKINETKELIKKYENKINKLKKIQKPNRSTKRELLSATANLNKLSAELDVYFAYSDAKSVWGDYWKGQKAPSNFNWRHLHCPHAAFIGSVVKQVFDAHLFGLKNDRDTTTVDKSFYGRSGFRIGSMSVNETSLFIAGTYNAGVAGFSSFCGTAKNIEECLNIYKKRFKGKKSETADYINAIGTCAQKDNWNSMSGATKICNPPQRRIDQ